MSQQRPRQVVLSSEELGESPVFPTIAILGAAVLYATLPTVVARAVNILR